MSELPGKACHVHQLTGLGLLLRPVLATLQELKKPLRVTFLSDDGRVAEEGVDQGGVSREFFQLLVGQLFSPDYGMFVEVEESSSRWFNTASLESMVSNMCETLSLYVCVCGVCVCVCGGGGRGGGG